MFKKEINNAYYNFIKFYHKQKNWEEPNEDEFKLIFEKYLIEIDKNKDKLFNFEENYECSRCKDTGEFTYSTFHGATITEKCPCNAFKEYNKRK